MRKIWMQRKRERESGKQKEWIGRRSTGTWHTHAGSDDFDTERLFCRPSLSHSHCSACESPGMIPRTPVQWSKSRGRDREKERDTQQTVAHVKCIEGKREREKRLEGTAGHEWKTENNRSRKRNVAGKMYTNVRTVDWVEIVLHVLNVCERENQSSQEEGRKEGGGYGWGMM